MAKNKLQCNVTGLWYGVSASRREKLIQKYGSFEQLVENYVSRDAVRLQKEGKSEDEIRAMVEAGELVSNTAAPKRASTRGEDTETKATKVAVTEPVEPEAVTEEDEDIDPDVKAFLDDAEAPTANASDKAI